MTVASCQRLIGTFAIPVALCMAIQDSSDADGGSAKADQRRVAEETTADGAGDLLEAGWAHLAEGRLESAEAAFKRALDLGAGARAHNGLGRVYASVSGRERRAERSFKLALALEPGLANAQYNLALLYSRWRPKRAVEAFERVLAIQPDHPEAAVQIGRVYARRDQPREALTWFRRQLETDPDHLESRSEAGRLLLVLGEEEDGVRELEGAIALAGRTGGPAHLTLALARQDAGQLAESHRLFRIYVESLPEARQEAYDDPTLIASRDELLTLERLTKDPTGAGDGGPRLDRSVAHRRYWRMMDPTPSTDLNEHLLLPTPRHDTPDPTGGWTGAARSTYATGDRITRAGGTTSR